MTRTGNFRRVAPKKRRCATCTHCQEFVTWSHNEHYCDIFNSDLDAIDYTVCDLWEQEKL